MDATQKHEPGGVDRTRGLWHTAKCSCCGLGRHSSAFSTALHLNLRHPQFNRKTTAQVFEPPNQFQTRNQSKWRSTCSVDDSFAKGDCCRGHATHTLGTAVPKAVHRHWLIGGSAFSKLESVQQSIQTPTPTPTPEITHLFTLLWIPKQKEEEKVDKLMAQNVG